MNCALINGVKDVYAQHIIHCNKDLATFSMLACNFIEKLKSRKGGLCGFELHAASRHNSHTCIEDTVVLDRLHLWMTVASSLKEFVLLSRRFQFVLHSHMPGIIQLNVCFD